MPPPLPAQLRYCAFDVCPTTHTQERIYCFGCKKTFHARCYDLTFSEMTKVGGAYNLQFICDECLTQPGAQPIANSTGHDSSINNALAEKIEAKMNALSESLLDVKLTVASSSTANSIGHVATSSEVVLLLQEIRVSINKTATTATLNEKALSEVRDAVLANALSTSANETAINEIRDLMKRNTKTPTYASTLINKRPIVNQLPPSRTQPVTVASTSSNGTPVALPTRPHPITVGPTTPNSAPNTALSSTLSPQAQSGRKRKNDSEPHSNVKKLKQNDTTECTVVVTNVHPSITSKELLEYIQSKIEPMDESSISAHAMVPKDKSLDELSFVSFKVTLPALHYDIVMDRGFWKGRIYAREYIDKPRKDRSGGFL